MSDPGSGIPHFPHVRLIERDRSVQIDVEEKTASLYTALLDVLRTRLDHPGQDKSRALRPQSVVGDTMQR
jgi:hypothetical protein